MKKFGLILLTLLVFNVSFANETDKSKIPFTFQNFAPSSADVVNRIGKNADLNGSNVSYPLFSGDATVVKNINKEMEKFIGKFKGSKNTVYNVTYTIEGSNEYFVSILFNVTEHDKKNHTVTTYNEAISFNAKNGKELELKDLFVPGFNDALNSAIKDKVKQFGIPTLDTKKVKFEGLVKNQKFYLEDDSIILFFNQGQATDFGNGQLFIPFMIKDLVGIIR